MNFATATRIPYRKSRHSPVQLHPGGGGGGGGGPGQLVHRKGEARSLGCRAAFTSTGLLDRKKFLFIRVFSRLGIKGREPD